MEKKLQTLLAQTSSYPTGTEDDWRTRYEPLIDEIVRHRPPGKPRISIVVVAWRSADLVVECLDRLGVQAGLDATDIEIILVDNGGLNSVRGDIAKRVDLELRMVGNIRLSRARNAGTAWANADRVAHIDDDGLVEPDFCVQALKYFANPDIVGIRGRVVARDHPYFTTLASHYDRGQWPVEDCLVTEGCSVLDRHAFMAVGGFAEAMSGHEGIDLTHRLAEYRPSAKVLYVPEVVMHHDYYGSWANFIQKSVHYADIDDSTAQRRPELRRFMDRYFNRDFSRSPRPIDEVAAGVTLSALRVALEATGRVKSTMFSLEPSQFVSFLNRTRRWLG